jgi:hypothetical protein
VAESSKEIYGSKRAVFPIMKKKRLGLAQFTLETCLLDNSGLHVNFPLISDNIICQQIIVKRPSVGLNKFLLVV